MNVNNISTNWSHTLFDLRLTTVRNALKQNIQIPHTCTNNSKRKLEAQTRKDAPYVKYFLKNIQ